MFQCCSDSGYRYVRDFLIGLLAAFLIVPGVATAEAWTAARNSVLTGAVALSVQNSASNCINVLDYNAKGDNSTDDLAAFNAATASAVSLGRAICIPRGSYVLGGAWNLTFPVDILMDDSASLRFTNASSCGIVMDLRGASVNFGLNTVRLGGLYSPSTTSAFSFPGYPSSWSAADRATCDAFSLQGGSRIDIYVKYMVGWNAGVRLTATFDGTNGARAPQNINVQVNTADIMTYGLYLDSGPSQAGTLAAINAEFNTIFARFPIYFNSPNNLLGQANIRVTGQAFTNEAGGSCIYSNGNLVETTAVDIHWCYAGYSPTDSPTGTSSTLSLPYLAGSASSNGQATDGNATVGYFAGFNNRISVGLAIDQAGAPGGALPGPNIVTRIRDAGTNNQISVPFYTQTQGAPTVLSSIQGEANYGGGVGAASVSKRTLVSIPVPSLAAGASANFYAYSTFISRNLKKPIAIIPADNGISSSGLQFVAAHNTTINREIVVQVLNKTSSSVPGATYTFWLITE